MVATEAAAAFRLQLASALDAVEALAAAVQERPQWADVQHSFGQLAKPLAGLAVRAGVWTPGGVGLGPRGRGFHLAVCAGRLCGLPA